MTKQRTINHNHPQWTSFWNNKIEFFEPSNKVKDSWAEIAEILLDWPNYRQAWLFIDVQGGKYVVVEEANGRFGTYIMCMMGGDLESFDTLEEAAVATFVDWFPEAGHGEWDDFTNQYSVDGEWLFRTIQI